MSTAGIKRVLVTGATGFIANRLIERLCLENSIEVVAVVRQFKNASKLARFPVKMVCADVTDSGAMARACYGCDAIVHCAVTFTASPERNRSVTVDGARNVCQTAKTLGVSRLVHLSTISVYGKAARGELSESSSKLPNGDAYGDSKLEAEQIVREFVDKGLPATILEPTVVYGPWSYWSITAARLIAGKTLALPHGGSGVCNAVYIDDVVNAILLGLRRPAFAPGPFLISGAEPATWRDFYLGHRLSNSGGDVADLSVEELSRLTQIAAPIRQTWCNTSFPLMVGHLKGAMAQVPGLKRMYRSWISPPSSRQSQCPASPLNGNDPNGVRMLPLPEHLDLLQSEAKVSIARAKAELGYSPMFDLNKGTTLTREWLKWSRQCG